MIHFLEITDFLDAPTREQLRAALHEAGSAAATVTGRQSGGAVETRVRKSARLELPAASIELVQRLVMERKHEFEEHFGVTLTGCEAPQFLRYETGDYFVAHQDGNTPVLYDDTRFRRVSVVIFMSTPAAEPAPDTYGGGALVFHGRGPDHEQRLGVNPPPGTLVAFRSETTHEVTPVTHGERYTIACFLRDDTR
ncbi:MAG TPA: 2OG-Fe(II) oxygenase [Longimicrobiales bacterium]|nr:2OG-Fe(II) oxygenase [Longimicrobiales bacterium]